MDLNHSSAHITNNNGEEYALNSTLNLHSRSESVSQLVCQRRTQCTSRRQCIVSAQKSRHRTSLSILSTIKIWCASLIFYFVGARSCVFAVPMNTGREREENSTLHSVQDKCARPAFAFECISPHNGLRELSSAWSKGYSPAALFISLMSGSHKKVSPRDADVVWRPGVSMTSPYSLSYYATNNTHTSERKRRWVHVFALLLARSAEGAWGVYPFRVYRSSNASQWAP